jgi:thiol:disulfide interchange protein
MRKTALIVLGGFTMLALLNHKSADGSDLPWAKDVKTAIKQAKKDKRLLMLDFTAKW